jgi:plasmid stabilization system protein ParE
VSYQVRYTRAAREDLRRLYGFLLDKDLQTARHARATIAKGVELLCDFPFSCRKAVPDNPFLRELVLPFGAAGYVLLFEIESDQTITILAVRHQREEDYL